MKNLPVIERALVEHDPRGILKTKAAADCYKTEAKLIAQQMPGCSNAHELKKLMHAIFVVQFGVQAAGDPKDYWNLANELWKEIKELEESNIDLSSYEPVVIQQWEESERGWGTRPDGISVHLTLSDHQQFMEEYFGSLPDDVPHEYSRPVMRPMTVLAPLDVYSDVDVSKHDHLGVRYWHHEIEIKQNKVGTRYLKRKDA